MSEQKRYTTQEMRNCADNCDWRINPCVAAMLRQAADAEDENAKLKERLEAVVKECERNEVSCRDDETFVEKTERIRHNYPFLKILRAARGEGGAE